MVFPEKLAFPVNKKFRLWISVIPVPNFPANFARRCLKISLELPVTIKASSMKSFGIVPNKEVEEVTRNSREYKRMLYAITIMHSVINAREKYGSFGWT
jgi:dynein heavy chain